MLRFTTTGAPFERGVQHGKACRELVLPWFRHRLEQAAKSSRAEVERWCEGMGHLYPDGIAENRGIAYGLGMEEASYFSVLHQFLGTFAQCTTCGLRDERGQPLLAKTDDLFADEVGQNVLETTFPDIGYRHAHFHFAGSIWTVAGMNECGLAIAMTGIPGPTLDEEGLPSLMGLHTILPACATVEETLTHLTNLRINRGGFSLLIGDAAGAMALVEKTGRGMRVCSGNDGAPFIHTNHILQQDFAKSNPPQTEPVLSNGRRRYENALDKVKTLPRSEQGLRALVSDRSGVGAICQQGEDGLHTDFAVIFNPLRRQFTYWPGPPATTKSEAVEMESVFA